jgi:hypothetical protein
MAQFGASPRGKEWEGFHLEIICSLMIKGVPGDATAASGMHR